MCAHVHPATPPPMTIARFIDTPSSWPRERLAVASPARAQNLAREAEVTQAPGGALYLEVPRAEYIEDEAALFDLHCAHVQYFRESNFLALATRAGLVAERLLHLKEGHDFGVLFRRGQAGRDTTTTRGAGDDLSSDLRQRREDGARVLSAARGGVALYGATWQGVAFLNLYQSVRSFAFAVDDLDAAVAELDGKVKWAGDEERWDHPSGTWYRYRSFHDPEGNLLHVTEPHKA